MKSNVAAYNQTNTKMPKKTGALFRAKSGGSGASRP